jgi:hypothetical protein
MAAPTPSKLDQQQVLQGSYDESTGRIRVDAELTSTIIPPPGLEVSINSMDDSVAIGNANNAYQLLVNPDGSINVDTSGSGPTNVNINGLSTFQTSQYMIGTSAVQITPTPLPNRSSIAFKATTTLNNIIYIGNSSSVTTSTGFALFNGDALEIDLTPADTIYAISALAGQTLYVLEIGN